MPLCIYLKIVLQKFDTSHLQITDLFIVLCHCGTVDRDRVVSKYGKCSILLPAILFYFLPKPYSKWQRPMSWAASPTAVDKNANKIK